MWAAHVLGRSDEYMRRRTCHYRQGRELQEAALALFETGGIGHAVGCLLLNAYL